MNLDNIIELINAKANLDLRDRKKTLEYVGARAVYYDLAYNYFSLGTLEHIAGKIGRHHATAVHSLKNLVPSLDSYFPNMSRIRHEIIGPFEYGKDYYDLKAKIDFLQKQIINVKNDMGNYTATNNSEVNSMVQMIKSVPDDKTSTLKTRLEPIIYMLCK
jgi:hypothetical protein